MSSAPSHQPKEVVPSLFLLFSVVLCTFAILAFQYFYYLPLIQQSRTQLSQIEPTQGGPGPLAGFLPEKYQAGLCNDIADGRSVPPDTMCIIKPGEVIQTFSAVKVWNYRDKYWMDPPGYVQAGERTLIDANEIGGLTMGPVLLSCPWGCTLGYPF